VRKHNLLLYILQLLEKEAWYERINWWFLTKYILTMLLPRVALRFIMLLKLVSTWIGNPGIALGTRYILMRFWSRFFPFRNYSSYNLSVSIWNTWNTADVLMFLNIKLLVFQAHAHYLKLKCVDSIVFLMVLPSAGHLLMFLGLMRFSFRFFCSSAILKV